MQKLIHILASISGKKFGYRFSFYTYGAFSSSLAADLDIVSSLGLVNVSYNGNDNSYSIVPTARSNSFVQAHLSDEERNEVRSIWDNFKGKSARQLELMSTILFIVDEERIGGKSDRMTKRVLELKPKYTALEVKAAQRELASLYEIEV